MSTDNTKAKAQNLPLNYFSCTLGEAAEKSLCGLADVRNINNFIDHQAEKFPNRHAVGFPSQKWNYKSDPLNWKYKLLTYKELRNASVIRAMNLQWELELDKWDKTASSEEKCIALLWPSSSEFLVTWLGMIRCGFSVLLIAPQCTPEAIAGLCKSCDVSTIVRHQIYDDLASKAAKLSESGLRAFDSPCVLGSQRDGYDDQNYKLALEFLQPIFEATQQSKAFIFHTSGTSTGIPSPIRQSHRAAFAVLPILDGYAAATFTTTPLYHGGIADCFRAWASGALIWLFPGGDAAITTSNIQNCMEVAEQATKEEKVAPVRYFSCVPYVLQMLSDKNSALTMLKKMEIVGVGGAALSKTLGDRLVETGVPLISRFGSAECGFLMSSYRNFDTDKDWDYLRYDLQSERLVFEACDDDSGLSELVVKPTWPHLAKTNRDDGSFATSDLFEPHSISHNAWRHHSRRDGQITLSTGKKFDPAPLEADITASSPLIREAIVVGTGRQIAGLIVFLSMSETEARAAEIQDWLWPSIEFIIKEYPSHARIFQENSAFLSDRPKLPRSSKGTLMRGVAEKMFADDIEKLYHIESSAEDKPKVTTKFMSLDDVNNMVKRAVEEVLREGQYLDSADDFYSHGVDSLMCTRIRASLQQGIAGFAQGEHTLPWNVVYDCGNIHRLSQFIANLNSLSTSLNQEKEMIETVSRFATKVFITDPPDRPSEVIPGMVVLLTGATGALGAHILHQLLNNTDVRRIVCLVRAGDDEKAHNRVSKSLVDRGHQPLSRDQHIICCTYDTSKPGLALKTEARKNILIHVTHIIHAAWDVNFSLPLRSFEPHLAALRELLTLAHQTLNPVTFSFCSSVASVTSRSTGAGTLIEETISSIPSDANFTGYGMSKWVAESICNAIVGRESVSSQENPKVKVKILRLGQLTGDTVTGSWNRSEAWPKMLSAVEILGCLPRLIQPLDWLPLDTAAKAVVETTFAETFAEDGEGDACRIYHIVQHKKQYNWLDLLSWIKEIREQDFEIVGAKEWLERLETYPEEHPAKALLGLWKKAYGEGAEKGTASEFAVDQAKRVSPTMRGLEALSEEQGKMIWRWLNSKN